MSVFFFFKLPHPHTLPLRLNPPVSSATLITDASATRQHFESAPTLINVSHTWRLAGYLKCFSLAWTISFVAVSHLSIHLFALSTATRCYWEANDLISWVNFLCQAVLPLDKLYTGVLKIYHTSIYCKYHRLMRWRKMWAHCENLL